MNSHHYEHDFRRYTRIEAGRQICHRAHKPKGLVRRLRFLNSEPAINKKGSLGLISRAALLLAILLLLMTDRRVSAQGCVASPNNPCSHLIPGEFTDTTASAGGWLGAVDYRWYESVRQFQGDEEITPAERNKNNVHTFNISANYGFNDRWSATINFPFTSAARSTVYEHDFVHRHTMHAGGLGDIRLVTDFWLLNPSKHMDGNIALGIGMKAPTGDDKASDTAFRATGPVVRPVDQSIQPGDGGWGLLLELQGYQKIVGNLFAYVQGSYLMTPQEMNDTETPLGDNTFIPASLRFNSIPDQYFGRGGLSYVIWPKEGVTLSLGSRIEGIPVYDAIGGSLGFRRPGYAISVEPGISWTGKNNSFLIYAPVAVYRTRERSASEIALGFPGGDASFADFSILASFTHRF